MKKIVFFILVALSINSFAKDYKVASHTICSGVESADKFKTLTSLGISEDEAATKIKGCKSISSKSYKVGSNTICSDTKSKNAFNTLLKVGYDENYAYKKVANCHPINSEYQKHHEKIIKQEEMKIYNFGGKEVYFRDSYYRVLNGKILHECFKTLPNGKYYYYMFDRDRGNELSFIMDDRNPRKNSQCPKYLIEKK